MSALSGSELSLSSVSTTPALSPPNSSSGFRARLAPYARIISRPWESPIRTYRCRRTSEATASGRPNQHHGRVLFGMARVGNQVDENGHDTPPGVGELIVASPYVASGIWVDGHCLPGSIEAGIEGSGAAPCRVFRTVDLVRQRPDGWLERIGRKDRQVKIRGTRVDLDGVEAALRKHPLGRDAGALARTNPIRWAAPVQGR